MAALVAGEFLIAACSSDFTSGNGNGGNGGESDNGGEGGEHVGIGGNGGPVNGGAGSGNGGDGGSPAEGGDGGTPAGGTPGGGEGGEGGTAGTGGTAGGGEGGGGGTAGTSSNGGMGGAPEEPVTAVTARSPAQDAVDVDRSATLSVTFDGPLDGSTVTTSTVTLLCNGASISGSVSYADDVVSFEPTQALPVLGACSLTLEDTILDAANNAISGEVTDFTVRDGIWQARVQATAAGQGSSVAVTGDGTIMVGWTAVDTDGGGNGLQTYAHARLYQPGTGFREALPLDNGESRQTQVFAHAGSFLASWFRRFPGDYIAQWAASQYDAGSHSWGAPARDELDFKTNASSELSFVNGSGQILMSLTTEGYVVGSKYTPAGSFAAYTTIFPYTTVTSATAGFARGETSTLLAYSYANDNSALRTRSLTGTTWSAEGTLDTKGNCYGEYTAAGSDSLAVVAWPITENTEDTVYVSISAGAASLTEAEPIATEIAEGVNGLKVAVSEEGGHAVVVWESGESIFAARYSDGEWGPALPVSETLVGTEPQVAVDNAGLALVVWTTSTGAAYARGLADGTWNTPAVLTTNGAILGKQLGMAAEGNAAVVYDQTAGTQNVWLARFE